MNRRKNSLGFHLYSTEFSVETVFRCYFFFTSSFFHFHENNKGLLFNRLSNVHEHSMKLALSICRVRNFSPNPRMTFLLQKYTLMTSSDYNKKNHTFSGSSFQKIFLQHVARDILFFNLVIRKRILYKTVNGVSF